MFKGKIKSWILLFAAMFIICIGAFLLLSHGSIGTVAVIRVDGEVYKKIDLDTVTVAYDIEIKTKYGYNKIHVDKGSICISKSDCRDQICVKQGKITDDGVPIICMPHRVTVEIEGDKIDA